MPLRLATTFGERLAASDRPLAGLWACAGSPLITEIIAGSGIDWVLIDMEHSANNLDMVLTQLQVCAGYPVAPVVRVPFGERVILKQVLDLGAQNVMVPMVSSVEQARELASAVRYPPLGVRGVGSALARSARWNRVDGYLQDAASLVSLIVQFETPEAVDAASDIASVDGVDAVFIGPSDLAAAMGHLGQQNHPEVTDAVARAIAGVKAAGKPVGVNAFDPTLARQYADAGADFVAVGADVGMLARSSDAFATTWCS